MTQSITEHDLRLVVAIARGGSVGAAARELTVSQPSASQRLARLERRVGVTLFERDTRGARTTVAGRELVRQAEHILGHLDGVEEAVRSASTVRSLVVGTFASLAASLFPALDQVLGQHGLVPRIDHGPSLVDWVGEGTMDAAFVAVAEQLTLPRTVRVRRVGEDRLVLVRPAGVVLPSGSRQPLRGLSLPYCTFDGGGEEVRTRLAALGATPRPGGTIGSALAMARRSGQVAVVPRSATAGGLLPDEVVEDLPFVHRMRLSMVTGLEPDVRLSDVLPALRVELGLG